MATTYKTTSLHIAVLFHTADEIAGLIEAGADVNERDSNGSTPLHAAARADLEHRPPDDAAREDEPRFEELED